MPLSNPTTAGNGSGVLASRPGAATVPAGYLYFATDDNGGTPYRSDGAAWTKAAAGATQSGGAELGYAEITSNFTATPASNTFVDITGLTTTVTIGSRPVLIKGFIGAVTAALKDADLTLAILEDGSIIQAAVVTPEATNKGGTLTAEVRRAPAAGSHTYKLQIKVQTSAAITIQAGAIFPAFVTVTER